MNKIPKRIKHFKKHELACRCCGMMNISELFLDALENARMIAGIPFVITSGCRCKQHNKTVGGKMNSKHLCSDEIETSAIDIRARNDYERGVIVRALFLAGIQQIGVNVDDNFIHCEIDTNWALWVY
ncbi:MAG: peptidase M15 [Candidatus Cloacimonetes bacterium]|nr:peptidase M15 [Candidatus Cloacimonadota bacterium]